MNGIHVENVLGTPPSKAFEGGNNILDSTPSERYFENERVLYLKTEIPKT